MKNLFRKLNSVSIGLGGVLVGVALVTYGVIYHRQRCLEYEKDAVYQKDLLLQQERENLEKQKDFFVLGYEKGLDDAEKEVREFVEGLNKDIDKLREDYQKERLREKLKNALRKKVEEKVKAKPRA